MRYLLRLSVLVEQFRSDPYWCRGFETGKYSDPARAFENFVMRQEGYALDRHPNAAGGRYAGKQTSVAAEIDAEYRRMGVQ